MLAEFVLCRFDVGIESDLCRRRFFVWLLRKAFDDSLSFSDREIALNDILTPV